MEETPRTYKEALKLDNIEQLKIAIDQELDIMTRLKVWNIEETKKDIELIRTKSTVGIDLKKTYAPTGRLNSLQNFIVVEASPNFTFHKINFKSAFLNAPLTEEVYLSTPKFLKPVTKASA
ncbi:hypothetical protein O181_048233 [Austropuccinia psidii MF-1]|uniref:Reverse transcriptase Ty1/copia-type domain-containing protein n=1 Tax=Austropuccinia psidii MF-1 TaxID=1389203 RepID=A0A9Q3DVF2_9BASI|nr:hypothetical protein [Austropuccinia psidii MF-1]